MNRAGGPLGVGVLGCGSIARYAHLRLLPRIRGVRLVAAADPDADARNRVRASSGIVVHESPEGVLSCEDVDAVIVCAPTRVHGDLARAAARAGKHVLVEKPLATSVEDARSVLDEVERAGVCAAVGFNRRFHPLARQARAIVERGTIGRVRTVVTAFCEPMEADRRDGWRASRAAGGGVVLDLASQHLDLVRWVLDDEIVEVSAETASDRSEHDSARLGFSLRSGVVGVGAFSFLGGFADFLEFVGEKGSVRFDRHRPALDLRRTRRKGYGVRRALAAPTREALVWRATRLVRRVREPSYRASLRAFLDHARGGPPGDLATLVDGVRNVEIVAAAEASAADGGRAVSTAPGMPSSTEA